MTAVVKVTGGRELIRRFEVLKATMQRKIARTAVTKAARKEVKVVKATILTENPPAVDTGLLRKSIGYRTWTNATKGSVGSVIGPRKNFGTLVVRNKKGKKKTLTRKGITKVVEAGGGFTRAQYADPVKYAHLVEGGRKRGERGTVEERPYTEHAFVRSTHTMTHDVKTELRNGLEREARKLAARGH